jgi:hypothetical protein
MIDHQLIAAAEIDDDVAVGLVRGVEDRLKRREIEVANVDAVTGLQVRDGVDAGALADEKGIVVRAADHHVLARTAEQQVSAAAAEEVILARLSNQGIVAAPAERMVISAAGRNSVVPAESEEDFAVVGSSECVVAARSELDSRFFRH